MTLTRKDLESADSRARVIERAASRDPREHPWGYFGQDVDEEDAVGLFTWFATREDLLEALVECEPAVHWELDEEEFDQARTELEMVRLDLLTRPDLPDEARERCSDALAGEAEIAWWGRFEDLVHGDGAFERGLRASFREAMGEEGDDERRERPVAPEEIAAFVEALGEIGG